MQLRSWEIQHIFWSVFGSQFCVPKFLQLAGSNYTTFAEDEGPSSPSLC